MDLRTGRARARDFGRKGSAAASLAAFAALLAAAPVTAAPPLPQTIKLHLDELTAAPIPAQGVCINGVEVRVLVRQAIDYANEIAIYAAERMQSRISDPQQRCSCLTQLGEAIVRMVPEEEGAIFRSLARLEPGCETLADRGIAPAMAPTKAPAAVDPSARQAAARSLRQDLGGDPRGSATPLLRPVSGLVGPTTLDGNS